MLSKLCNESDAIVNNQRELVNNINRNFQSLLQMASKAESQSKDVTVINQLVDTHQNYLYQLRDYEITLRSTCEKFAQSKALLTKHLLEKLKVISTIQYNILKLNKKMQTFVSILKNIMSKFHHVSIPKYLPGAYAMALLEILRRKSYSRKFESEINRASEILSEMRDEEIRNRKSFFRSFGKFLPPQLIDRMNELPASGEEILNLISSSSLTENSKLPNISTLQGLEDVIKMEEIEKTFNDTAYFGETSKLDFKIYAKLLDENNLFHQMSDRNLTMSSFHLDLDRISTADSDSEHHGSSASSSPRSFKARNNLDDFEKKIEDLETMERQLTSTINKQQHEQQSELQKLREENELLKLQVLQLQKENEQLKMNKQVE